MDYLLDTNFLIALWRQPRDGAEARFLKAHGDCVLALPWIVRGEFLAGALIAGHDLARVEKFLSAYPLILPCAETTMVYARLYSELRRMGERVSINDLWIASTAVEHGLPLLARNTRKLSFINELNVLDYTNA